MLRNRKLISVVSALSFLLISTTGPAFSAGGKNPPVQLKSPQNIVVTPTLPVGDFTVSWSTVPNASSYTVRVYNASGKTLAGSPITSATSVLTVTRSINTSYRVSVQAIGNGTTYLNSPESGKYSVTTFASSYGISWFHNGFGGSSLTPGPTTYTTAASIGSLPATTTRTGYSFDGWYVDSGFSGSAINSSYTPASPYGARTFYAKWNTTVTFDGNTSDGGATAAQTAAVATALTSNGFTKTGYTFAGWNTLADGSGTPYADQASYPFSGGAATLYAQWTATSSSYAIGDAGPGGGIIYYYDSAGFDCGVGFTSTGSPTGGPCHYLEVAPSGWNTGADPTKVWAVSAYQGTDVSGITNDSSAYNNALGIGLGYKNSDLIVAQGNDTTTAAGAARAYAPTVSSVTYSDWYLPTTAELNLLCQWNRGVAQSVTTACTGGSLNSGTGATGAGFVDDAYWSSSGYGATVAWFQFFNGGAQLDDYKTYTLYVRPVRAF